MVFLFNVPWTSPVFWVWYSKHFVTLFLTLGEAESERRGHHRRIPSPLQTTPESTWFLGVQNVTLSNVQQAAGSSCGNLAVGALSASECDVCTTTHTTKEGVSWTPVRYPDICSTQYASESPVFIPPSAADFPSVKDSSSYFDEQFVLHTVSANSGEHKVPLRAPGEFHQWKFNMCVVNQNS